ncbi:putative replicative DNA helicase [uncultured virus]|jgi:replicative DNA helicase|uniref:Putative replicative DNA helicase n=1 Tax=uncultured virus TaxID=340016 RepID=A0A218MLS8_9VIRU|nr:putative replicative DNA helicase [uncultured virus]UAW59330.1 DNA helicase [Pelagibacter phage HTVC033P]
MIEKQMIRLMLNKKFYTQYKGILSPTVFAGDISSLYDTIQKAHEKYEEDIKVDELYSLHTAIFNPALTRAAKEKFSELVEDIKEVQEPNKEIAKDIMRILSDRDLAQRIAVEATEIFNGKEANFAEITGMIDKRKIIVDEDKAPAVTNNINEVLDLLGMTTKWKFNIPMLRDNVGGIGGGNLMISFARPETGKTAFWISLCSGPEGFAQQGAKIHAFINEEPAIRTQMRAISCFTGMTREEIIQEKNMAQRVWSEIKDNISMFDTVDWSMEDIDAHCEKHRPDIIVIDQLDKVNVTGTYARTDEKLRQIYTSAREIAKRRDCAVIAMSQASADAHNRNSISFDQMENSKTGKAAEADLIIGIGRNSNSDTENKIRTLCISKNKINGYHGEPVCTIRREISRYEV